MSAAPRAILVAVTDQARTALGGKMEVRISEVPFRVGRESRANPLARMKAQVENRMGQVTQVNHLYLIEPAPAHPFHISRQHFLIDWADGRFVLVDRESACGTIVGEVPLGAGTSELKTELRDGDRIIVGSCSSPYVFLFRSTND